jgi:class 3 adenylate cyclase/predicted ATPase
MICPHCGAAVASGKKFCGDCGAALPWRCQSCGSDNPADKRFCGDCGAARTAVSATSQVAMQTAAIASSPERRLMTVVFVDLVGSTALGQRLDPEELRKVMADFHDLFGSLITAFNGFIARYMGDGVLVYFGYPQAHETDAERAIRAGLAIVDAIPRLDTLAGPPGTLRVRVGIDSGLVVVGDQIGFGSARETAVVGDVPNLAARLQTAAEAGTVVISEATRLLVGNLFEYRALELANLKGRRGVERAWVVLRESVIESRYEALRGAHLPLVNRTEELDLLLRRWDQAKTGEGRVVLLAGEAGIGKSRLIAALEQYVGTGSHLCLRFLCSPHHLDTPLYPIIRHIERAAKFQHGDSPAAKWDKLATSLPAGASSEDKALMADLLSIQCSAPDLLKNMTPQRRKAKTFATIIHQIDSLAQQSPILATLEDMHWADPSTLELVDLFIETVQRLPLLLVITARPEVHPAWAARPHVTVSPLSGLDARTAAILIKQVAGGQELPRAVIDRIVSHADSVPLFMEELTKTVLATHRSNKEGDQVLPIESLSVDAVPTSLHSSLMARLDRLPVGKQIAQIGAVIGREFSFEMIQAISHVPAKRLEQALAELAQAEIIVAYGKPPLASYTFRHALVQDAAYASLLRDRRREIHQRLAEELEKDIAGAAAEPQLIAWHYAEAGLPDQSIHYYLKAAERATGRFALTEMVNHLRHGVRQITHLPESAERQRRELSLQLALGRALIDHEGGNSESVRTTFERASQLCVALDEVDLLPRVYDGLIVNHHFIRSQPEKILQYTSEIVALHRRTGDPRALLMTRRAGCLANLLLGHFEAAREEMQKLIDMYDPARDGPQAGMSTRDPKVSTSTLLGICLTILGYPDSGAAMSLAGVQHAASLNHVISLNLGLRRACAQAALQRDTQRVAEFSDQLVALNAEYETYKGSWEGTFFHDWAQLHARSDLALFDRLQNFLRHLDATKNWALLPFYMALTAELSGRLGDVAIASALLERATELVKITGARWWEAEITRLRARFSAHDVEESETLLQSSLATAREQGAKLWELRASIDLTKLLREQGKHTAARELLEPTYRWFSEGWGTPDLVTARKLLDEIGQHHS